MTKRWKVVLFVLITALILNTAGLAAQEYAVPGPQSNAHRATQENFGNDVDNFLGLHSYGDVEFEKFFSYLGFREYAGGNPDFGAYELNAGYARHFGGLYLGLFYAGQITEADAAAADTTTTDETTNALSGTSYQKTSDSTTIAYANLDPVRFYNNLTALIGVAGMGIKVGFYETLYGTSKYPGNGSGTESDIENDVDGTKRVAEVTDYKLLKGWIVPQLGWGMKLPVGGLTVKPKVNLDLAFYADSEKYAGLPSLTNTTVNGQDVGTHNTRDYYRGNGFFALGITLGADVDFAPSGSSSGGAGLAYTLAPRIYSHKYDSASGGDTVKGTVTATNTTQKTVSGTDTTEVKQSVVSVSERAYIRNVINPSFWYANDLSDQVSLGAGGGITFTIDSESTYSKTTNTNISSVRPHSGSFASKTTTVTVRDTANNDVTTFNVESSIGLGLRYKIKPDRFTLNAGLGITLPAYKRVTTHTKPLEAETVTTDTEVDDKSVSHAVSIPTGIYGTDRLTTVTETTKVEEDWSGVGATFSLGGTFWFTPNFAVDMYFDNVSGPLGGTGTIGAGGVAQLVTVNYSLLFTLKI
jgi:hypothetical protein